MAIRKRPAPQLRPEILETAWWGDDNLDQDQSDLNEWCRTADIEHLKPLPGQELAIIKYRGLTPTEYAQVPNAPEPDGGLFVAQCYQACRYGLISIRGYGNLSRAKSRGIRGLTQAQLDELSAEEVVEDIPMTLAMRELYELKDEGDKIENITTPLAVWLGVHILRETFRPRNKHGAN
jgi:hypothetical protein